MSKKQWNISLNISPNSPKSQQHIGKNIIFNGDSSYYYRNNDIVIIGYGRIYNEPDLWIDILKIPIPVKKTHSLLVVIELYNKFGFEKMMEYLDGDFSFILFDINLYGDESIIYVVRDPFGLCPLYQWVSKNTLSSNSKRVQFQNDNIEQTIYVFSSSNYYSEITETDTNIQMESIYNGTYLIFTHSFKVSANWKFKKSCTYYILPYHTTYKEDNIQNEKEDIEEIIRKRQFQITIHKIIKYILYHNDDKTTKIGIINFEKSEFELSILPYSSVKQNQNEKLEFKQIYILNENILEFEKQYPSIIQKLKIELNNNDPSIIRANFVPLMIAKFIKETEPNIKYIIMEEPFVYKWIFINVFERRQELNNAYFQERIKGWVHAFFVYNIDLIIPFLDRILLQKI